MISSKGEYAARALLHLALIAPQGDRPIKSSEIGRQQDIPKKYLQQILLLFKKAGLVGSKPGLNGGYFLARPAQEITMAQIIGTIDGSSLAVGCANMPGGLGCTCTSAQGAPCALRTVWEEAGRAMVQVLEATTLEELATRALKLSMDSAPMYYI